MIDDLQFIYQQQDNIKVEDSSKPMILNSKKKFTFLEMNCVTK